MSAIEISLDELAERLYRVGGADQWASLPQMSRDRWVVIAREAVDAIGPRLWCHDCGTPASMTHGAFPGVAFCGRDYYRRWPADATPPAPAAPPAPPSAFATLVDDDGGAYHLRRDKVLMVGRHPEPGDDPRWCTMVDLADAAGVLHVQTSDASHLAFLEQLGIA